MTRDVRRSGEQILARNCTYTPYRNPYTHLNFAVSLYETNILYTIYYYTYSTKNHNNYTHNFDRTYRTQQEAQAAPLFTFIQCNLHTDFENIQSTHQSQIPPQSSTDISSDRAKQSPQFVFGQSTQQAQQKTLKTKFKSPSFYI